EITGLTASAVGSRNLGLEGDDPFEPRLELVHGRKSTGLGVACDADREAARPPPLESCAVAHEVTLIPGDGTGPELTEATRRGLQVTGVGVHWDGEEGVAERRACIVC